MRALILKGDDASKQHYIDKYIKDDNILLYNIVRFEEPLKIGEVREIKKLLSRASTLRRVFIIVQNPTLAAQNALLKTLEELDESTDFIFAGEEELLPTISSRCQTIRLFAAARIEPDPQDMNLVEGIFDSNDVSGRLFLIENFFASKREDYFRDFILIARTVLLKKIADRNYQNLEKNHNLLTALVDLYPIILSNNLNKKMAIERIFTSSF